MNKWNKQKETLKLELKVLRNAVKEMTYPQDEERFKIKRLKDKIFNLNSQCPNFEKCEYENFFSPCVDRCEHYESFVKRTMADPVAIRLQNIEELLIRLLNK